MVAILRDNVTNKLIMETFPSLLVKPLDYMKFVTLEPPYFPNRTPGFCGEGIVPQLYIYTN